ncbi:MAG: pyridoxal phosphate-dependent aminotransferase [Muribaculaceae bacterium]|nr:pyridoxal phosphate-dependent aminotransferase [Muribaculaceae bacterium]
MNRLSDRINALAPSATLAMSQKSSELRAQGVDVINLSVGEPDFFTPDHIKAAAKQAVDDNFSFYSPVPGYLSLRQAVCEKLRRENGLEYTPDQIVIGNGAKHELCNVIMALINPGDEVIIPTPAWVSYVQMVNLAGGKSVLLPSSMDKNFKVTADELEAAITPKTRLIIICSPSNPSGAIYTRDELKAIADMLERHPEVMVIADEIYEHINYVGHHESLAQFDAIKEQVVIINGVSKAYAMTGYRIGYIAAPLWVSKAVNKMQGQYTSGVSSIAQKAAEAAYNGPQECVEEMRVAFERRRNLIVGLLQEIPGIELNMPDGAFYAFPKIDSYYGKRCGDTVINDDNDLALYLLNEAHVATVAGTAFCCPGYIRLSYATSDENLREAAKRIAAALAKLA